MDLLYSIAMFAAAALVTGAVMLWRRDGPGRHVWLMFAAAAVIVANVLIWVLPPL